MTGYKRHYTEAETRNQWLCSCDDCSRRAAGAWIGLMGRVLDGDISLTEAQALSTQGETQ